ncbi:VWA containing CoxE family protein [Calothrix sp. NIES-4071]|nr:VWA containing CoxE family protein [Calothrix sp. NIES-4071]BAZ56878.1 VWA containing CoxE family protein [Calothrix sp. NIES-4105]
MNEPALLELFNCLRKAGLSLGLAEYNLLLQAINAGFGTRDRDALAQLCRALWVKSQREEQIFQDYFDQIIPSKLEQIYFPNETEDAGSTKNREAPVASSQRGTFQIPRLLLRGLATCIVVFGSVLLLQHFTPKPKKESNLAFSSLPFLHPTFIVNTNEKLAHIKITRTGDKHGVIKAKLNIGKKCLPKDSNDTPQDTDTPLVIDTTQNVEFKNGEGEITIPITLLDNDKANFYQKFVELCLSDPQGGVNLDARSKATLIIQKNEYLSKIFRQDIIEPLLIISTCIILLLVAWKMRKIRQTQASEDKAIPPDPYINLPKTALSAEVIRTMTDEIQVAKAIRQSPHNQKSEIFPLIVNDLPITHRQMKQGWRYLRQFSREGAPIELDIEATIQQVAQQGILLNPILVPQRTNRIELLLLIDRDGSMVPFHHLSQELADTALRGGRFSKVKVYYFHNCPNEYLYRDPYHLNAETIDDCLSSLPKTRTVCLIFSDAGAARGRFSSKRRRLTKFFLKELGQYVRYTAWLNPVPRSRWETTTAHDIAALVPMFEVNRHSFYTAIDVLRGRYQP